MALQVWLPLNKDLRNQGLTNIEMTSGSTTTYDDNGVIGKCLTFSGDVNSVIYDNDRSTLLNHKDNFSWAMWVNTNYATGATADQYVFTVGRADMGTYGYGMACTSTSNCNIRFGNQVYSVAVTSGQWTHIAFTKSGNNIKIYKNGQVASTITFSGTLPAYISSEAAGLGLGSFYYGSKQKLYPFFGKISDVRIYNHCLSDKEVKEISKALVLNYKLNDANVVATSNIIQDYDTSFESIATGATTLFVNQLNSGTIEIVSNIEGHSKCLHIHSNGTNNRCYRQYGNVTADTYVISVDYYSPLPNNMSPLRVELNGGGYKWNAFGDNYLLVDYGSWKRYYLTLTTTATTSVYLFFMCSSGMDAYFDNVQMERGSYPSDYTKTTSTAGNVCDSSGYRNDGTVYGSLTLQNESARYDAATVTSTNNCIIAGRGGMVKDAITVSIWGYMNSWASYNARLISCTEGGGWNFEPSNSKMQFAVGTGVSSCTYKLVQSTKTLANLGSGWHHFVGTYDGLNAKIYIDGVLEGNLAAYTTATPIFYNASNGIFVGAEAGGNQTTPAGNYYSGALSDLRIYGTALSAEDVAELYHTGASIDNKGNFFCGEIKEV